MFNVSAEHIAPEWCLSNVAFANVDEGEWSSYRVKSSNGEWYAIAPQFGCGHNKPTAEAAIRSLLLANGCHSIQID